MNGSIVRFIGHTYLRPDRQEIVGVVAGLNEKFVVATLTKNGRAHRLVSMALPPTELVLACQVNLKAYARDHRWPICCKICGQTVRAVNYDDEPSLCEQCAKNETVRRLMWSAPISERPGRAMLHPRNLSQLLLRERVPAVIVLALNDLEWQVAFDAADVESGEIAERIAKDIRDAIFDERVDISK